MFVSEANFTETELVRLRIVNTFGEIGYVEVDPSETVETLTFRVLNIYLKLEEPDKILNQFKLVLGSCSRVLSVENSIAAEGLKNDDEILLVTRRQPPSLEAITDDNLKGPTQSDIDVVTAKLRNKFKDQRSMATETSAVFQSELRKVIISIVEAAARVLAYTPQANQIIELMKEKQLRKSGQSLESKGCDSVRSEHGPSSTRRTLPTPDPNVVAQLVDMGFSEEMVLRALRSRRMNQALEWLLENSSSEAGSWSTADDEDVEDDADLAVAETVDGQTNWTSNLVGESSDQEEFVIGGPNEALGGSAQTKEIFHGEYEGNRQQNEKSLSAAELLQSFEAFKKHQFRPSPKAMNALLDMGFSEDEVMEALKATGNNQVAACEWLLMENKAGFSSASSSSSWEEADEGLDPNSPAFKAILAEPLVQLSLTNPKLLLAYLSILETPASASIWINDLDASPVLNQIFKTYNAEKHSIQTPTPEDEEVANDEATTSE